MGSKWVKDADYTEDYVACNVHTYFSALDGFRGNLCVVPISRRKEATEHYDAFLEWKRKSKRKSKRIELFYMQYKRPIKYLEESTSKIVKFRRSENLQPDCFAFKLNKTQHNGLLKLKRFWKANNVAYVCPTFIDRFDYQEVMHLAFRFNLYLHCGLSSYRAPLMSKEKIEIIKKFKRLYRKYRIPLLPGHVCIPPHARINGNGHKYSFSEKNMNSICYHSGKVLEKSVQPFEEWFNSILISFLESKEVITEENSYAKFNKMLSALGKADYSILKEYKKYIQEHERNIKEYGKIDFLTNWEWFGDYLWKNYSICQQGVLAMEP